MTRKAVGNGTSNTQEPDASQGMLTTAINGKVTTTLLAVPSQREQRYAAIRAALDRLKAQQAQTPAGPVQVNSIQTHIRKPAAGHKKSEHKQLLVCYHCKLKGHYARNCRTRKKEQKTPAVIRTTNMDANRYSTLGEENLDRPTSSPFSSPPFKHPKATTLGCGLDLALPPSHHSPTPQGSTKLDAKRINKLIAMSIENYSREERLRVLADVASYQQKAPVSKPAAQIPDPTSYISRANLMALQHDTRLEILDQLVPQKMWGTPKHIALLESMGIDAVAIHKRNTIHVVKATALMCDLHVLVVGELLE